MFLLLLVLLRKKNVPFSKQTRERRTVEEVLVFFVGVSSDRNVQWLVWWWRAGLLHPVAGLLKNGRILLLGRPARSVLDCCCIQQPWDGVCWNKEGNSSSAVLSKSMRVCSLWCNGCWRFSGTHCTEVVLVTCYSTFVTFSRLTLHHVFF